MSTSDNRTEIDWRTLGRMKDDDGARPEFVSVEGGGPERE